jgi:hypothetical protein
VGNGTKVRMVVEYLCGEVTAVENPVKSRMLSAISFRGVIIFRDGNSLLDCNKIKDKEGSAFRRTYPVSEI